MNLHKSMNSHSLYSHRGSNPLIVLISNLIRNPFTNHTVVHHQLLTLGLLKATTGLLDIPRLGAFLWPQVLFKSSPSIV